MVRFMGREDDILLINFMTGARDVIGAQENVCQHYESILQWFIQHVNTAC